MKKNKFLALTMLCSTFCGMPAKARGIKDSGSSKTGELESHSDKKTPNLDKNGETNKSEKNWKLSKKEVAGGVYALHEVLSIFWGGLLQFYNFLGRFSLSGLYRWFSYRKYLNEFDNKFYDMFNPFKVFDVTILVEENTVNILDVGKQPVLSVDVAPDEKIWIGICIDDGKRLVSFERWIKNFKQNHKNKEVESPTLSDNALRQKLERLLEDFLKESVVFFCFEGTEKVFVGVCPKWLCDRLPKDCDKLSKLSANREFVCKLSYRKKKKANVNNVNKPKLNT